MSTERQLRNRVVTIMKGWLDYGESNGKHRVIIDTYNRIKPLPVGVKLDYDQHWCAATVSAAGWKAGLSDIILPECSCGRMIELYKKAGRWMERDDYVPSPGDIVMYDWADTGKGNNLGHPDHVGFVVAVSGGTVQAIEGNMNDKVGYRYLKVNGKFIRGYCLPDYASKAEEDEDMDQATFDKMLENYLARKAKEAASPWAVGTVALAKAEGIMDGNRPRMFVTREECATMVLNSKK